MGGGLGLCVARVGIVLPSFGMLPVSSGLVERTQSRCFGNRGTFTYSFKGGYSQVGSGTCVLGAFFVGEQGWYPSYDLGGPGLSLIRSVTSLPVFLADLDTCAVSAIAEQGIPSLARGQQSAVIVDDSRRSGLLKKRSNGIHHSLDVSSDKCRRCGSISPKKEIGEHRVDSERASSDSEKSEHSEGRGRAEQERESQRITVLSNLVVFSGPHGMANLHVEKGDSFTASVKYPFPCVHGGREESSAELFYSSQLKVVLQLQVVTL